MKFPVYPEKFRKIARFKLKIRCWLLLLLVIGILMFFAYDKFGSEALLVAGFLTAAIAGSLFFITFNANDALIEVEIGDDRISLLDKNGKAFRSTEYRYIRSTEVRSLQITGSPSDNGSKSYGILDFPGGGIDVKLIMVYFDGAGCFEDLHLRRLSKKNDVYWCDKIFYHYSCIAYEYSDEAWKFLNAKLTAHAANNP